MTAKETFLKRLLDQINSLQSAYDFNKGLPDSFFEGLNGVTNPQISNITTSDKAVVITGRGAKISPGKEDEYGRNRRLVREIIKREGRFLLKSEIETFYREIIKATEDQTDAVTNAISGLIADKTIKGYKPTEFKVRGNLWGLPNWFQGDEPLEAYKPRPDYILCPL